MQQVKKSASRPVCSYVHTGQSHGLEDGACAQVFPIRNQVGAISKRLLIMSDTENVTLIQIEIFSNEICCYWVVFPTQLIH